MGLFSVSPAGRLKVWQGLLADFQADGRVWGKDAMLIATDVPGSVWFGTGVGTFNQLKPLGNLKRPVATALNTTASATATALLAAISAGLITSTSAAAVVLTLPTAVQLAAQFSGVKGVQLDFVVDNTGPNSVTVAISAGVTVNTAVITGSDNLVVAAGKVGIFRLYFVSATAVLLSRVS